MPIIGSLLPNVNTNVGRFLILVKVLGQVLEYLDSRFSILMQLPFKSNCATDFFNKLNKNMNQECYFSFKRFMFSR
jgi:hypothetical protein